MDEHIVHLFTYFTIRWLFTRDSANLPDYQNTSALKFRSVKKTLLLFSLISFSHLQQTVPISIDRQVLKETVAFPEF